MFYGASSDGLPACLARLARLGYRALSVASPTDKTIDRLEACPTVLIHSLSEEHRDRCLPKNREIDRQRRLLHVLDVQLANLLRL